MTRVDVADARAVLLALVSALMASGCIVTAPASDPCFPVAPMALLVREHDDAGGEPQIALAADGTITGRRRILGRVAGDRIVDPDGAEIVSCGEARTLRFRGSRFQARFSEHDEFVDTDGTRVVVTDEGVPILAPRGMGIGQMAPGRFQPFDRRARRTAVMLVLLAMMQR